MINKNKVSVIVNLTEDSSALKPLTNHRPIGALPFASRYRLIDFILSNASDAGVKSVALFIGETGRSIYDHIRSGKSWRLNSMVSGGIFTFSHQDWKRHIFKEEGKVEEFYDNHLEFIKRSKTDYIFITGETVLANVDIIDIHKQHQQSGEDITVVYSKEPRRIDTFLNEHKFYLDEEQHEVEEDNNEHTRAVGFSLGMYLISSELLLTLIERAIQDKLYLNMQDLIEEYINDYDVNLYEYTGYASKIETIEQYFLSNMDMLKISRTNELFNTSTPIMTKPKHGTPAYYAESSHVRDSYVGTDSLIYGEVHHSMLNRRIMIHEKASVHHSILFNGVEIGEGARVEYAILDKHVVVDPGVQIIGTADNIIVLEKYAHATLE